VTQAWDVFFANGNQYADGKTANAYVRAVRGGPAAACGDGAVEADEQCDDGNLTDADGCASTCTVEVGWTCSGQPTVCTLVPCPANASGAPNCGCNSTYAGTLTWRSGGWGGTCVAPPRGVAGDKWADLVIGKPAFSEINPNTMVDNKLFLPPHSLGGGVIVDRTVSPNRLYIYDSGNNRILGLRLDNPCFASSTNPLGCAAELVIGQPGMDTSACNGDSGFQTFPARARASASSGAIWPQR